MRSSWRRQNSACPSSIAASRPYTSLKARIRFSLGKGSIQPGAVIFALQVCAIARGIVTLRHRSPAGPHTGGAAYIIDAGRVSRSLCLPFRGMPFRAADDATPESGHNARHRGVHAGSSGVRPYLSCGAGAARHRTVPGRQYRDRIRHDIYGRRAGAACHGLRADPRQRDLRRDRARQAVSRRYPAAARPADAGLQQCRGLSRVRSALPDRVALCRRRLQPALASGHARRPAPIDRTGARPRAAPGRGQRRFPARPAFDAVRDRAADAGRSAAALARRWRGRSAFPS